MNRELGHQLETIERLVQSWLDFSLQQRNVEGLATDDATQIMTLPVWPCHGQLNRWVDTLREARLTLGRSTREIEELRLAMHRQIRDI